jgi:hypothetical protein
MVKTFANFVWAINISKDSDPPFAEPDVSKFVSALNSAGLAVSKAEDDQYAWNFQCELAHLRMDCQLGLVPGDPERWLLACYPFGRWLDRLRGRSWDDEQARFVSVVDTVLRADSRVSDLVWFTKAEWDQSPR